mgnify:CR=1 FL=1
MTSQCAASSPHPPRHSLPTHTTWPSQPHSSTRSRTHNPQPHCARTHTALTQPQSNTHPHPLTHSLTLTRSLTSPHPPPTTHPLTQFLPHHPTPQTLFTRPNQPRVSCGGTMFRFLVFEDNSCNNFERIRGQTRRCRCTYSHEAAWHACCPAF